MKAVSFTGTTGEYFKIWIVNIALTLITLGIYYPWAKVRNKKYFYSSTSIEGRNFEYHATGKQLFIGYLIAMALLITYLVIQKVFPIVSLGIIVVVLLALPWVVLRSMVFNMKMTSFSNVRFSFNGSMKDAYNTYLVQPMMIYIAIIIVGGVFFAIASKAASLVLMIGAIIISFASLQAFGYLKKIGVLFILDNTQYGSEDFKTNVQTEAFFMILLKAIAISFGSFILALIILGGISYVVFGMEYFVELSKLSGQVNTQESSQALLASIIPIIGLLYFVMIAISIFITAYIAAKDRTYIFQNTNLGEKVKFSSTFTALPYGWLLFSNLLAIICTLGLAIPWTKIRRARFVATHTLIEATDGFDSYITKKTKEESSLGEQVGDAFDVDVGIGV